LSQHDLRSHSAPATPGARRRASSPSEGRLNALKTSVLERIPHLRGENRAVYLRVYLSLDILEEACTAYGVGSETPTKQLRQFIEKVWDERSEDRPPIVVRITEDEKRGKSVEEMRALTREKELKLPHLRRMASLFSHLPEPLRYLNRSMLLNLLERLKTLVEEGKGGFERIEDLGRKLNEYKRDVTEKIPETITRNVPLPNDALITHHRLHDILTAAH
jgi:hypothetical protein